jgi:type I restriction enzyme S subunit
MDSYKKYKNSGIDWIGKIPEHWEIKKLKHVSETIMGQSPHSEDCTSDEIGLPFLQGNAEFGTYSPTAKYYCDTASKYAPQDSILLSVRAPVGAINKANKIYGIGRGLCAIISDNKIYDSNYIWYVLIITRNELWQIATGSTYTAVSLEDVINMQMFIPPLSEQRAIASYLDKKCGEIDLLVENMKSEVELLREYRTVLISEVVTGKVKVCTDVFSN